MLDRLSYDDEMQKRWRRMDRKVTQLVQDYLDRGFLFFGPESCSGSGLLLFDEKKDMVYFISYNGTNNAHIDVLRNPLDEAYKFPNEENWELVFREIFE